MLHRVHQYFKPYPYDRTIACKVSNVLILVSACSLACVFGDPVSGDHYSGPACAPGTATGSYMPCTAAAISSGTCCTASGAKDAPVFVTATTIICRTPSLRYAGGGALPVAARVGISINGQAGPDDASFLLDSQDQERLILEPFSL